MDTGLTALLLSTVAISFVHTASGPDHYLPFIVFARSRKWSLATTAFWTSLCGLGHVFSSVLIGLIGVFLGWQLSRIEGFQEIRGGLASWSLLILGLVYLIWGLVKASQNRPHKHFDSYGGDELYVYTHRHGEYVPPNSRIQVTPWILLGIFVMGPSEATTASVLFGRYAFSRRDSGPDRRIYHDYRRYHAHHSHVGILRILTDQIRRDRTIFFSNRRCRGHLGRYRHGFF
jgi:hypothetical protein